MRYLFGKRVRRLMELRDLKQDMLARGAGVAQSTINRILHERNVPNMDTIIKISQALNVPLEALTHPNDIAAEIIYELHYMDNKELNEVLENIRKEKLWKSRELAKKT